ncbi:MAG: hypothetical protein ACYTAF_01505 [Planctomycetota bacterium]|jgi:hypothetical protein
MMHALLLVLVLFAQEEPDRSTPEKAAEGFSAFYLKARNDESSFLKIEEDVEKLADFCYTDAKKMKLAEMRKEYEKIAQDYRILGWSFGIAGKKALEDGRVAVDANEKRRRKEKDWENDTTKVVEETLPYRIILEKVEGIWMVGEIYDACVHCEGSAKCGYCKGAGKVPEEGPCTECAGNGVCGECKGAKLVKNDPSDVGSFPWPLTDGNPDFSTDLSSPEATARTFADQHLRMELQKGKEILKLFERILGEAKLYFAPELWKKTNDSIRAAVQKSRDDYRKGLPRVGPATVKGDTAHAVVVRPGTGSGEEGEEPRDSRRKINMKKVGDIWLVDSIQDECWSCGGTLTCGSCKGTGKSEGTECWSCSGKKECQQCNKTGWGDPE